MFGKSIDLLMVSNTSRPCVVHWSRFFFCFSFRVHQGFIPKTRDLLDDCSPRSLTSYKYSIMTTYVRPKTRARRLYRGRSGCGQFLKGFIPAYFLCFHLESIEK